MKKIITDPFWQIARMDFLALIVFGKYFNLIPCSIMFWFIAALSINVIAILLIIANALYDAITLQHSTGHNDVINLIGAVLAVVVVFGFSLKTSGSLAAANVILWIPAAPLVLCFGFSLIYMAIIFATKPDWK